MGISQIYLSWKNFSSFREQVKESGKFVLSVVPTEEQVLCIISRGTWRKWLCVNMVPAALLNISPSAGSLTLLCWHDSLCGHLWWTDWGSDPRKSNCRGIFQPDQFSDLTREDRKEKLLISVVNSHNRLIVGTCSWTTLEMVLLSCFIFLHCYWTSFGPWSFCPIWLIYSKKYFYF